MSISEIKQNAKGYLKENYSKVLGLSTLYIIVYYLIAIVVGVISSLVPIASNIITFCITTCVLVPITFGFTKLLISIKNREGKSIISMFREGFQNFERAVSTWWSTFWRKFLKMLPGTIIIITGFVLIFIYLIYALFIQIVNDREYQNLMQEELGDDYYEVISACYSLVQSISPYASTFDMFKVLGIILMILGYFITLPFSIEYVIYEFIAVERDDLSSKEVAEETVRLMKGNRLKYIGLMLSFILWFVLCFITCGIGFIFLMPYIHMAKLAFYESLKDESYVQNVIDIDNGNSEEPKEEDETEPIRVQ